MKVRYPSSFLKLLLIGFAFAILPLLWAFVSANISFGKLAKQSERTISQAVETTRAGRVLQEELHLMERSIRQYYVLQDDVLFNNYLQANRKFNAAIEQLQQLSSPLQQKNVTLLQQQAQHLHQTIIDKKAETKSDNANENEAATSSQELDFLNNFNKLAAQIQIVNAENNRAIDNASTQLRQTTKDTQKSLFAQSLILIPLALLVAGIITFLLARPIRRMDSAIRDLGEGLYGKPITIDGPGDLRVLGQRLDWLRGELNDLNTQKQQFLRHVSHELKTPLTAIREATELLHDGVGGALTAQQTEITQILRDNSLRLQKMIENLLNHTKIESIQSQLNLQAIDLTNLINKVISGHALTIRNKVLDIQADCKVDKTIADEEKLTIIMDNLISNAVKFTPEHGQIRVNTARDKKWLVIHVADSGPGLAQKDREQLFDPFYRGDTMHNSLIKGSGLGLTIAKDLVKHHGGNLELAAETNHLQLKGAHFVLRLPFNSTEK